MFSFFPYQSIITLLSIDNCYHSVGSILSVTHKLNHVCVIIFVNYAHEGPFFSALLSL